MNPIGLALLWYAYTQRILEREFLEFMADRGIHYVTACSAHFEMMVNGKCSTCEREATKKQPGANLEPR